MSASATSPAFSPGPAPAWIISQREDLIWFIGSAFVGYLALALMWGGFPVFPIQVIWMLGIDGPHVLATVTRTYFDRQARKELGPALWVIVPFMLAGPIAGYFGQLSLFFLFAICWQHFHIVKQHDGFVVLYKAKNKERNKFDLKLDRWFLIGSLWVPLAGFVIATRAWLQPWSGTAWQGAVVLYLGLTALWIGRQTQKIIGKDSLNLPKISLIAAVVPLQWLAFHHAAEKGPDGIIRAGIALGLFHSLQYHGLLWFPNRNRYSGPEAQEHNGLAARVSEHVWIYMAVAATWGLAFAHYFLDSKSGASRETGNWPRPCVYRTVLVLHSWGYLFSATDGSVSIFVRCQPGPHDGTVHVFGKGSGSPHAGELDGPVPKSGDKEGALEFRDSFFHIRECGKRRRPHMNLNVEIPDDGPRA